MNLKKLVGKKSAAKMKSELKKLYAGKLSYHT
jgi:hypothetical protein